MPMRMVSDKGNCMSAPMEPLDIMATKRNGGQRSHDDRHQAFMPRPLYRLHQRHSFTSMMVDGVDFKIESLITIPAITMTPVIDIISIDIPSNHNISNTQNTSSTISDKMMAGCIILSNCAARMKYKSSKATTKSRPSP